MVGVGRLPWLAQVALSVLGGHTLNAASEGCHSIAQRIMSTGLADFHMWGDDMDPPDDCLSP